MIKKIIKGVLVAVLAIATFLGVMLLVQNVNKDLDDITLIVNNFKRVDTLSTSSVVLETKPQDNSIIYRIGDKDSVMVLEVDKEWVNNQKSMKCWKGYTSEDTTESIMQNEPTHWQLTLMETNIGVIALYKEIYMNQQAYLDSDNVLKDVLDETN